MDNALLIRVAVFVGLMGFLFGGVDGGTAPVTPPAEPYSGSMTSLHSASRTMAEQDRVNMSMAFDAGSRMVAADSRNLLDRTDEAQSFVLGILSMDYNGLAKPIGKYPSVATEIEKELTKAIGDEVAPMNATDKAEFEACLREIGKAVR